MNNFIINDELRNLLPPLSEEERDGLEKSILEVGVLTPLIVWNDTIIDGHCRYDICIKHEIPFCVKNIAFESVDDAKYWIWEHHTNRRNLAMYHRAELALKLKATIAAKAKERQMQASLRKGLVNGRLSSEAIKTKGELGKLAGASHSTLEKVEYLVRNADDATKNRLRNGEKGTSIHREYCRLKAANDQLHVAMTPSTIFGPKIGIDDENDTLLIRRDATPKELAAFIVEYFPAEFVRSLFRSLMKWYDNRYGNEATQHFLLKIIAEYID